MNAKKQFKVTMKKCCLPYIGRACKVRSSDTGDIVRFGTEGCLGAPPKSRKWREGTSWQVHRVVYNAILVFFLAHSLSLASTFDQIRLRDGRSLEGRVITEQRGAYLVQPADTTMAGQLQIPQNAVKYILYADSARADQYLGLSRTASLVRDAELATATILPTQAFGEAIVEAVRNATESIWITVFYISGSQTGAIGQFYSTLREKARDGLDVVMICEFGGGTRPSVRHATLNFATELESDGIEVLFIQEHRSMHKKMIIVDGQTVLLGSSNLTLAGTMHSNEMNLRINSDRFTDRTMADFKRLRNRAIWANDLR